LIFPSRAPLGPMLADVRQLRAKALLNHLDLLDEAFLGRLDVLAELFLGRLNIPAEAFLNHPELFAKAFLGRLNILAEAFLGGPEILLPRSNPAAQLDQSAVVLIERFDGRIDACQHLA